MLGTHLRLVLSQCWLVFHTGRKWKIKSLKPRRGLGEVEVERRGMDRVVGKGWKRMLHIMLTTWAFCKLCR